MYTEKNITKKSNLELNDSLSCYLNHEAQQNHYAYEAFYNLLNTTQPSRILEIGTAMGGFTMFLRLICNDLNLNTDILTYDINDRGYKFLEENNVNVKIENIFYDNYSAVKQEVIDYIQQDGTTIVLCDGGYKIGEFNILSNYIKQGDIIMAHDYASNNEYFQENINMKFWNWLEIQDSDIQESVEKNNLKPFMKEEFTQAVWVCKIK